MALGRLRADFFLGSAGPIYPDFQILLTVISFLLERIPEGVMPTPLAAHSFWSTGHGKIDLHSMISILQACPRVCGSTALALARWPSRICLGSSESGLPGAEYWGLSL